MKGAHRAAAARHVLVRDHSYPLLMRPVHGIHGRCRHPPSCADGKTGKHRGRGCIPGRRRRLCTLCDHFAVWYRPVCGGRRVVGGEFGAGSATRTLFVLVRDDHPAAAGCSRARAVRAGAHSPRSNRAVAHSPRSAPASRSGYGAYAGNAAPGTGSLGRSLTTSIPESVQSGRVMFV